MNKEVIRKFLIHIRRVDIEKLDEETRLFFEQEIEDRTNQILSISENNKKTGVRLE